MIIIFSQRPQSGFLAKAAKWFSRKDRKEGSQRGAKVNERSANVRTVRSNFFGEEIEREPEAHL